MSFFTEADIAPEWGVVDRDGFLRTFWKQFGNDLLQGVLAASVAKIQTQNWELEGPEKLADFYHPILRDEADFHRGYSYMVGRGVIDYYTQDNGWFMERRRASVKDLAGPMLGIAHLDSSRMRATGNADYPFTYNDVQGEYHLMHRSQFIRIVDMPTPETQMHGIEKGFCALSRALSTAIILTMLVAMKREKLADLPPSALAIFNNINRKQFTQAMTLWGAQDDMTGNVIWRQLLPLFGIDPAHPAGVQFISLREVWEGYDDMTAMNIAAYSFAAAWRMDPREFWPVSQGPLGTGREAEIQHEKAKAKSHGLLFTELERVFNADESLPRSIHFRFAMQDIEEEQQKADIHAVQIMNIKSMQEAGAQLSAPEVRHLLTTQYRVIPQIMAEVPVEGEETDLSISDVHIDDVEREFKEFKEFNWGPKVRLSDMGEKEYLVDPLARAMLGLKGGAGSGNYGHTGRPGMVGGSGGRGGAGIGVVGGDVGRYGDAPMSNPPREQLVRFLKGKGDVELWHVTSSDHDGSVSKAGLVPAASEEAGQCYKAPLSKFATYFFADRGAAMKTAADMAALAGKGSVTVWKATLPRDKGTASRILPDEDVSLNPNDGLRALLGEGSVAVVGGVHPDRLTVEARKQYAHGPGGVFSSPGIEGGDEQKKCPKCGAKVKPDAKKCPKCGAVLKWYAEGVKGGAGSGNYGHAGRPGMVGGSGGRGAVVVGSAIPKSAPAINQVYHGTSGSVAARISREGLKAFRDDELDRSASVYYTEEKNMAIRYGKGALRGPDSTYAVVTFNVPTGNRIADEIGSAGDWRIERSIPASAIISVEVFDARGSLIGEH
jgi:hypothetical protein